MSPQYSNLSSETQSFYTMLPKYFDSLEGEALCSVVSLPLVLNTGSTFELPVETRASHIYQFLLLNVLI
jgi:hypothetical protein